jgi:hypothetical protein
VPEDGRTPPQIHSAAPASGSLTSTDAVVAALKPLLSRVAAVTRMRRAALVAGCMVFPLLALGGGFFAMSFLQGVAKKTPGLMNLSTLLQTRSSAHLWASKKAQVPSDRQIAIYIAHHYRGIITNETSWSSPSVMSMIKGEARKFAEQSVAEHPEPTEAEIAQAGAEVDKYVPKQDQEYFNGNPPRWLPAMAVVGSLAFYVCIPALIAALAFRGGLVLLIAGVTFVRKDGQRASRLRLLWRGIVAWSPVFLAFILSVVAISKQVNWGPWLTLALPGLLAVLSVALPGRGLQDRLAGTWPVPR